MMKILKVSIDIILKSLISIKDEGIEFVDIHISSSKEADEPDTLTFTFDESYKNSENQGKLTSEQLDNLI